MWLTSSGLVRQRDGQDQNVGGGKGLIEGGQGKDLVEALVLARVDVDADQLAGKDPEAFSAFRADAAAAEDDDGFPGQLAEVAALFPSVCLLVFPEERELFVDLKHAADGELGHRGAVDAAGVVNLDAVRLYIIHRDAVEARAGELDEAEVSELFDWMMQKQAVADQAYRPCGIAGQRIGLILEKNRAMAHGFDLLYMFFCIRPGAGNQDIHFILHAAGS